MRNKKELIEWIAILGIIGLIYFTGLHTVIIGKIQQAVLYTGLISPEAPSGEAEASYDMTLEDLDGNRISLQAFDGQVVFMNFWATWCPPCIAEMPDIHDLYLSTGSEVQFVMISLDRDEKKARKYLKKKAFSFPVYFLRSSLPANYNISSIPTTYVIDKEGQIQIENVGMAKYNTEDFRAFLLSLSKGDEVVRDTH
ncbi:MAG: redoxin domain-containing protein [Ekhidna sp.]